MTLLCTYLIQFSHLILFTPRQPFGWTLRHPDTLQLFKLYLKIITVHIISCLIQSRSCCEHCPRIIDNVCPLCFWSLDCFSQYVFHFPSCLAFLSLNNTISSGSSCLASSFAISFWILAKVISRSGSLIRTTCSIASFLLLASWIRLKFASLWPYLITCLSSNYWS